MAAIYQSTPQEPAVAQVDPAILAELIRLALTSRSKAPEVAASPDILSLRRDFLRETVGDSVDSDVAFERIIGGDELQPISYLERGMIAARAVARMELGAQSFGTGFLISPRVLITNNHVLPDAASASRAQAQFRYELDLGDAELPPISYRLMPGELFHTRRDLDYTVVAVEAVSQGSATPLSDFGCLPLIEATGKVSEGEWLTIIQHPDGGRKQICVRENQFIKRGQDVIWYTTDTKPGSSGSPVFNNDWFVVALHNAGVPEEKNGVVQKNPDGSTKWVGNQGIRVSRIVKTLRETLPDHPLLRPLYAATPATARITTPRPPMPMPMSMPMPMPTVMPPKETRMSATRTISVPLEIRLHVQSDGSVMPVSVTAGGAVESTLAANAVFLEKSKKAAASFDVPFDSDYSKRKGYQSGFLGKAELEVGLPHLDAGLQAVAAPLLQPKEGNRFALHYHNYSVVMHKHRRLPIFSAANVSFANRFDMNRPADVWRRDPRILAEHQLENWYYARNNFDRGHMTRREDLEFGAKPAMALASAADTCHWTNCVPQHSRFNQNKEIWHGIERYVLEQSILGGEVNAQIITGPILDDGDPDYREIQYPVQFWKVVAAVTPEKKLFATAYIASQVEVIAQFGIETTEAPFGPYKTFQTKIAEIERLTGLTFVCGAGDSERLRDIDPLKNAKPRRRRRSSTHESTGPAIPEGYYEITDLTDIQL